MNRFTHVATRIIHVASSAGPARAGIAVIDGDDSVAEGSEGATPSDSDDDGTASSSASGPELNGCTEHLLGTSDAMPDGLTCAATDNPYSTLWVCFEPDQNNQCSYDEECVLSVFSCGLTDSGDAVLCGPIMTPPFADGDCCYVVAGGCAIGRPFTVAGVARIAQSEERSDWVFTIAPGTEDLDEATRAALADAWVREAQAEHASVASFSRFVLQLLAVGAPAELVTAAQRAIEEELLHARIGFGLASHYGRRPIGPGPLDIADSLGASDLRSIAKSVAREGAIAETVSAAIVQSAADIASEPSVKVVLKRIAGEELKHAELAWLFLRWALQKDPGLKPELSAIFARARHHVGFGAVTPLAGDAEVMTRHGYLSVPERRAIAEQALSHIVAPAANVLLTTRIGIGQMETVVSS